MPRRLLRTLALVLVIPAFSQTQQDSSIQDEILTIYTDAPRLFLRPQRQRLLRRERERRSMRWLQFETLMVGKAPMPEPGFAAALYYQASGDAEFGRQAIRWALGASGTDLRQLAIVFDWCEPVLTEQQGAALAAKLEQGIQKLTQARDVASVRNRTLAAVALAGRRREVAEREMQRLIRGWWRGEIVTALKQGRPVLARDDSYALFEILHAVRDNLNIELRDPLTWFFKDLPIYHLLSYYPASYPAAENEYRIPAMKNPVPEPDLNRAAMSRAAELSMVAYDVNSPGSQVLQGWLMHNRFLLRGTFGIPYEFLWANPYQPGLSYYHVPLIFYDPRFGRLFVRSSWEDSAAWLGYSDGQMQWFEDGRPTILRPELSTAPLAFPDALVIFGEYARKFHIALKEDEDLYLVGLKPHQAYDIEVDDMEILERSSDAGGILEFKLPPKLELGIRMRPAAAAKKPPAATN